MEDKLEEGRISEEVVYFRDSIGKLQKELSTLRSKVDNLQGKVHWYESTARWLLFIVFYAFVMVAMKHETPAKQGPAVGQVRYGLTPSDNSRYEGRVTWDGSGFWRRNGFGTNVFTDKNAVKEGFFKNDKLDGLGRVVIDKALIEGQYKDDLLNGYGTIIYPHGSFYRGQFKNHQRSGYGMFVHFSNNRTYEGYWENNKLREDKIVRSRSLDNGNTTNPSQPEYIGTMNKQYAFHGKGTMFWPDTGIRFEATWENGKPIGKVTTEGGTKVGNQQDSNNNNNHEGMFTIPVVRHVPGRFEDYSNIIKLVEEKQKEGKEEVVDKGAEVQVGSVGDDNKISEKEYS